MLQNSIKNVFIHQCTVPSLKVSRTLTAGNPYAPDEMFNKNAQGRFKEMEDMKETEDVVRIVTHTLKNNPKLKRIVENGGIWRINERLPGSGFKKIHNDDCAIFYRYVDFYNPSHSIAKVYVKDRNCYKEDENNKEKPKKTDDEIFIVMSSIKP